MSNHRAPAPNACLALLCFLLIWAPALVGPAEAQPTWHNLDAGEYSVGFRLLEERDETRVVAGRTEQTRPIRIYLWYPASVPPGAASMSFGRYVVSAEEDVWPTELVGPLREKLSFSHGALARSLGPDGLAALSEQPVRAFENAEPLPGPFPLIAVGQGLSYESPIAFSALSEYLAGRGFVVATCPLAGTQSLLVRLDLEDLETAVRDLEFVIARARKFPNVRSDELGVMGFDMGGMAGLILAMRNPSVDAFASVPAGILYPHPSGLPAASPDYDPRKLKIPWLHAGPPSPPSTDAPAASLFETAVHSERYLLSIEGMKHVESTSYALVGGRQALPGLWPAWEAGGVERHETLIRYVAQFFNAFLRHSEQSLAFLSRDPEQAMGASSLAMEHRSASRPAISYPQFVDSLLTGDAARAIDEVRAMRATEPKNLLLNDFQLYRLAYSLRYSWGLGEEARKLSELNMELNPASRVAAQGLSMSYVDRGDYDAAIEVYRKLLEKNPDDTDARRTLEWLQAQRELSRKKD